MAARDMLQYQIRMETAGIKTNVPAPFTTLADTEGNALTRLGAIGMFSMPFLKQPNWRDASYAIGFHLNSIAFFVCLYSLMRVPFYTWAINIVKLMTLLFPCFCSFEG